MPDSRGSRDVTREPFAVQLWIMEMKPVRGGNVLGFASILDLNG
jgi:hypothetical protein